MKKAELIEKLEAIPSGTWNDGMGMNDVSDFVDIPEKIESDQDIMDALWWAIENRIENRLDAEGEKIDAETLGDDETWQNVVWENWCNQIIDIDFSDIQKMLNCFDAEEN